MKLLKFAVPALLFVILNLQITSGANPPVVNSDIYGRWRISKVLGASDIAAMSDKEAQGFVGKTVMITKNAFVFNGETCDAPSYERSQDDLVKSFRELGNMRVAALGLPDPVTSIDARCTHLFLKKSGVIVVHWNGFYFDAIKRR